MRAYWNGRAFAEVCLGVPFQVQEAGDFGVARARAATGEERLVQTLLLDDSPQAGDWLLVHIDTAVQTLTAEEALQTNEALLALGQVMGANASATHAREQPSEVQRAEPLTVSTVQQEEI